MRSWELLSFMHYQNFKTVVYIPGCGWLLPGRMFPVIKADRKNYYIPVFTSRSYPVSKEYCERVTLPRNA